jgi:long-chain acyl-CoA synthetase
MTGIIHVPVFTSLNISEYQYIINHCEAKLILVSDKKLYNIVIKAVSVSGISIPVYSFDAIEGVKNWKEIAETGSLNAAKHNKPWIKSRIQ